MALLTKKKFSFVSKATDKDSFAVVSFKGFEAISKPYQLEIVLISEKAEIDPLQVLKNPAVFTIHRDNEQDVVFNGILIQFEETQEVNGYLFFKAVLAPKLQRLSLTPHNQVFLDQPVPKIIEAVLKDAGLAGGIDFDFKLQGDYQPLEYVCQYDESYLNFISRWAEREGIYYFFEQSTEGEKIVFTDTKISHIDLPLGKDLIYQPQSGLDSLQTKEVVKNFLCKHNLLPQKVYLKDYNYRKPSLAMEGSAEVDIDGWGEHYLYGEHFTSPEEGNKLAKIRAEEFLCRKSVYYGASSIPFLVPGFTFDLTEHYSKSNNKKYLLTEVSHEGHQTGYLVSGISAAIGTRSEQMFYANTFTAIPADVQFRPERTAVKPKIPGTFNAKVDAASSGQYAELDDQGRYKVVLPLDRSGRGSGKASAWCRMTQPYAGADYGMHFPLHKGTEVLLTFIDGDPDRPIIVGSVPNPETGSPVKGSNQTQSVIRSGGGNQLHMGDQQGEEEFAIHAQKDMNTNVNNDRSTTIVGGNDTLIVQAGTRSVTVQGDTSLTVQAGNRTVNVTGNYQLDTTSEVSIQAPSQISLTCGGSSITMVPGKITLSAGGGAEIVLDGNALMTSKGSSVLLDGNAFMTSKGGSGILLDSDAFMISSADSSVLLTGNATLSGNSQASVEAPTATLSGGGSTVTNDAGGVSINGPMVKMNG